MSTRGLSCSPGAMIKPSSMAATHSCMHVSKLDKSLQYVTGFWVIKVYVKQICRAAYKYGLWFLSQAQLWLLRPDLSSLQSLMLLSYTERVPLQVLLNSPMLLESELEAITSQAGMMNKTFNLHYESGKPGALKAAVETLCRGVEEAVKNGCEVWAHT